MIGVELACRAGRQVHGGKRGSGRNVCMCVSGFSPVITSIETKKKKKKRLLAEWASVIGELGAARSEAWLVVATW